MTVESRFRASPASSNRPLRVALVSAPWPLFNRPSVQLGALKAFLADRVDWIEVEALHPYLEVAKLLGLKRYHRISQSPWAGEALYGALLFPEKRASASRLAARELRDAGPDERFEPEEAIDVLGRELDRWCLARPWEEYDLVGFSVCFNQLVASLAAARALKARGPCPPLVFGGSSCAGGLGAALLRDFPEVDYVVDGEGELSLLALCEYLGRRRDRLPPAVLSRRDEERTEPQPAAQLEDLADLPAPAYHDYFRQLGSLFAGNPFIPQLPVEFSRGCWWRKCAFCNLNLQWRGYRMKKAAQVLSEIRSLAAAYGVLDFAFTDNALPVREAMRMFADLGADGKDFRFFGEIRATERGETLQALARGGLHQVQVGIEALSDGLLRLMGKGATLMDNLMVMKEAVAAGIELEGNLIVEFPGSTRAQVEETMAALEFVFPYPPLRTAVFFLGHGSPVAAAPRRFGIRSVVHHAKNRAIWPKAMLLGLPLLVRDYRGGRERQRRMWRPVVDKVAKWRQHHARRQVSAAVRPLLSFREGGNFLLIRQEAADGRILHHRLRGASREIYLFCETARSVAEIGSFFPKLGKDAVMRFLEELRDKRLLFSDGERCLALAVRWTNNFR